MHDGLTNPQTRYPSHGTSSITPPLPPPQSIQPTNKSLNSQSAAPFWLKVNIIAYRFFCVATLLGSTTTLCCRSTTITPFLLPWTSLPFSTVHFASLLPPAGPHLTLPLVHG